MTNFRFDQGPEPRPAARDPFRMRFSTVEDGNMLRTQAERQIVQANRQRFFSTTIPPGMPIIRIRPSHSPNVDVVELADGMPRRTTYLTKADVEADFDFYEDGADGLLTTDPAVAIALISGDCLPVLIWDAASGVFGIIHVGLLGALNNMVSQLPKLAETLGARIEDIHAYLGPSIGPKEYDISRSGLWLAIEDQVRAKPHVMARIAPHLDRGHLDMRKMVAHELVETGILATNIEAFEPSTAAENSQYFSHYAATQAGGRGGGFCSIIWRAD